MNTDREAIAERLQWLAEQAGGTLTPEAVVRDAMSEESPLHAQFEWDQSKAAWEHWLEQARQIIRSVRVVFRDDKQTVSVVAYVRDPRLSGEQGYLSTLAIRTDQDLARESLVQEFGRAAACLRRAKDLAVAFSLDSEIESIQTQLTGLRARIVQDARVD